MGFPSGWRGLGVGCGPVPVPLGCRSGFAFVAVCSSGGVGLSSAPVGCVGLAVPSLLVAVVGGGVPVAVGRVLLAGVGWAVVLVPACLCFVAGLAVAGAVGAVAG